MLANPKPMWCTLFLVVTVASCTGSALDPGPGPGGSTRDLSSTQDLTFFAMDFASSIDMSSNQPPPSGTQPCSAVLICIEECDGNTACNNACLETGTLPAQTEFEAIISCAYAGCNTSTQGAPPPCMNAQDQSSGCFNCESSVAQSPACANQLSACFDG